MAKITKDTTIEEAAMVHGLDCEALMEDITDYLESVG